MPNSPPVCFAAPVPLLARPRSACRNAVVATAGNGGSSGKDGNGAGRSNEPRRARQNQRRGRRRRASAGRENDRNHDVTASAAPRQPFSLLPDAPFLHDGFDGWRAADDDFWRALRAQKAAFRAPTLCDPSDLRLATRPLDRHGRPVEFPAAAVYDTDSGAWRATTAEEQRALCEDNPEHDPYFVPEAAPAERHTSAQQRSAFDVPPVVLNEDGEQVHFDPETMDIAEIAQKHTLIHGMPPPRPPATPSFPDVSTNRRRPLRLPAAAWRVVHLGTSSAIPTRKRNVSSTAMLFNALPRGSQLPIASRGADDDALAMCLVDVGENTNQQLLRAPWCLSHGFRWIRAIFITHLHGDHIYGLPSLLAAIGRFAQYRRRAALQRGEYGDNADDDEGHERVIRIFGPYGTRGFVRASLHWTRPLGVRFSVSELVARAGDFAHVPRYDARAGGPPLNVHDAMAGADAPTTLGSGLDLRRGGPPPPHAEEVRADDVHADEDGVWRVWRHESPCVDGPAVEVLAAPLVHRMPCFGYVFRELPAHGDGGTTAVDARQQAEVDETPQPQPETVVDMDKARALGVRGRQFTVLRSGRSVTARGRVVTPADVALDDAPVPQEASAAAVVEQASGTDAGSWEPDERVRKVVILGDTCDSSAMAQLAADCDLLVHEATFTEHEADKARIAMHSTARMAGEFASSVRARKVALTHFSSRYEGMSDADGEVGNRVHQFDGGEDGNEENEEEEEEEEEDSAFDKDEEEDEDLVPANVLVEEARAAYGTSTGTIMAAHDFLEHDVVAEAYASSSP